MPEALRDCIKLILFVVVVPSLLIKPKLLFFLLNFASAFGPLYFCLVCEILVSSKHTAK